MYIINAKNDASVQSMIIIEIIIKNIIITEKTIGIISIQDVLQVLQQQHIHITILKKNYNKLYK